MYGYFLVTRCVPIVERDHVTRSRENILSHVVSSLSGFVDLRLAGKFIFIIIIFIIILIISSLLLLLPLCLSLAARGRK